MISRRPGLRPVVLKIGTLDNPLVYGGAQKAIFTAEGQRECREINDYYLGNAALIRSGSSTRRMSTMPGLPKVPSAGLQPHMRISRELT